MFSVCTNHCLGHLSLKVLFHLYHCRRRSHHMPGWCWTWTRFLPVNTWGKGRIYNTKNLLNSFFKFLFLTQTYECTKIVDGRAAPFVALNLLPPHKPAVEQEPYRSTLNLNSNLVKALYCDF